MSRIMPVIPDPVIIDQGEAVRRSRAASLRADAEIHKRYCAVYSVLRLAGIDVRRA
jgi:hypothetical protein